MNRLKVIKVFKLTINNKQQKMQHNWPNGRQSHRTLYFGKLPSH